MDKMTTWLGKRSNFVIVTETLDYNSLSTIANSFNDALGTISTENQSKYSNGNKDKTRVTLFETQLSKVSTELNQYLMTEKSLKNRQFVRRMSDKKDNDTMLFGKPEPIVKQTRQQLIEMGIIAGREGNLSILKLSQNDNDTDIVVEDDVGNHRLGDFSGYHNDVFYFSKSFMDMFDIFFKQEHLDFDESEHYVVSIKELHQMEQNNQRFYQLGDTSTWFSVSQLVSLLMSVTELQANPLPRS